MIEVGSLESNDLKISYCGRAKKLDVQVLNLVGSVETSRIQNEVLERLGRSMLPLGSYKIIYNGANGWVIQARIEALREEIGSVS